MPDCASEEVFKNAHRAFGHATWQGFEYDILTEYGDKIPLHVQNAGLGDVPGNAQAIAQVLLLPRRKTEDREGESNVRKGRISKSLRPHGPAIDSGTQPAIPRHC